MRLNRQIMGILLILSFMLTIPLASQAQEADNLLVTLSPTDFAAGLNLGNATGDAFVVSASGYVQITLNTNGGTLPQGVVLEGWLVDAGTAGGPGVSNVSNNDELLGVSYLSEEFDALAESTPFALSTGVLSSVDGSLYELAFQLPHINLSPYDAVVITAESDGNQGNFDPRPGTPVLSGDIASGTPSRQAMREIVTGDDSAGTEINLQVAIGDAAYSNLTGSVRVHTSGRVTASININGVVLPQNTVLEVWLIDAGLNTNGPGRSNASDADELYGTSFGNADLDASADQGFYALSTGVAQLDASGAYTLDVTFPNYQFISYDAVLVTFETDGNATTGYDPRPGSPAMLGMIADGVVFNTTAPEVTMDQPAWQTLELTNAATGEIFTIADLNAAGFTVFVEPMATWCSNCRRQQQTLTSVFNTADPHEVVFISLSVETNISDGDLADYAAREGFDWTFVVANEALLAELVNLYGRTITNPPSTPHFAVYPDGSYSELTTGFSSADQISMMIAGQ